MSEEESKLQAVALAGRSLVKNLRRLEELCMIAVLDNAPLFAASEANPLDKLSPTLHRDFLKFLELQGRQNRLLEDEELDNVFALLKLLLDESTSEFDFIVYSRVDSPINLASQETWQLLTEKCPNLVRITDGRSINFYNHAHGFQFLQLASVWPYLLKMPNLLHIDLCCYVCEESDLIHLAEHFPHIFTLSVTFMHLSYQGMKHLFKLKKLEVFKTNWSYPLDVTLREVMEFSQSQVMDECVKHLPALKVACTDNSPDTMRYGFHNSRTGVEDKILALECLRVKQKLKGWSAALVPNVTNLWLQGPLDNISEFLGFQNLTTLKLCEVNPADTMKMLSECKGRLRELTIFTLSPNDWFTYDPHKIFFLCPRLQKLDLNAEINAGRPDLYPVDLTNFESLKSFEFYSPLVRFPSSMVAHILKAKNLDYFGIINLKISPEDLADVTRCLINRTILQNLREFRLTYGEANVNQDLIKFLKLLPVYAPKLRKLGCFSGTREFLFELRNANIGDLVIPGFEFEMNDDFEDLLEG